MKKILKKTLLSSLIALSFQALSVPMSHLDTSAIQLFTNIKPVDAAFMQSHYTLFTDSVYTDLVYYIAKKGYISEKGSGQNSSPDIGFLIHKPHSGLQRFIKPNEYLMNINGAFDTGGKSDDLLRLQQIAAESGIKIAPAPVLGGSIHLFTDGSNIKINEDTGEAELTCKPEEHIVDGRLLKYNNCNIFRKKNFLNQSNDKNTVATLTQEYTSVPVNLIESFAMGSLKSAVSASGKHAFTLKTPIDSDFVGKLKASINNGVGTRPLFGMEIKWDVQTNRATRKARITADWQRIFEQTSEFTARHDRRCKDVTTRNFTSNLIDNEEVTIEVFNPATRTYEKKFDIHDAGFTDLLNKSKEALLERLFTEIRTYKNTQVSQLGKPDESWYAIYTERNNKENSEKEINTTIDVRWNPGNEATKEVKTLLNMSCLKGGFEYPVRWNYGEESCNFDYSKADLTAQEKREQAIIKQARKRKQEEDAAKKWEAEEKEKEAKRQKEARDFEAKRQEFEAQEKAKEFVRQQSTLSLQIELERLKQANTSTANNTIPSQPIQESHSTQTNPYQIQGDYGQDVYDPHTNHNQSNYRPHTNHNQSNYRPHINHNQSDYGPFINPNQSGYRPHINHNQSDYGPFINPNQGSFRPYINPNQGSFRPYINPNQGGFRPYINPNQGSFRPFINPNQGGFRPYINPNQGGYGQPNYEPRNQNEFSNQQWSNTRAQSFSSVPEFPSLSQTPQQHNRNSSNRP